VISGGIVRPKSSGGSENPSSANRSRACSHRGLRPVDEREREAIRRRQARPPRNVMEVRVGELLQQFVDAKIEIR
jgi:hypothetical protein